jgi:hypothetical protein
LPTSGESAYFGVDFYVDKIIVGVHEANLVTKTISSNGTYNPADDNADGYSQVTVNVSGGGVPLLTSAEWNALTTAQKQSYGLVAIQNASSGYKRGTLVNGADYTEPKAVHIWTKSTGGNDAAMYVQNGYWDVANDVFVADGESVSVLYSTVQSGNRYNCNGIATLGYPSGWNVIATDAVTDGISSYVAGDTVKSWIYSTSVDFYVYLDE